MNEIQRINPPSAVILNERKYPVITNDPSFTDICKWQAQTCASLQQHPAYHRQAVLVCDVQSSADHMAVDLLHKLVQPDIDPPSF
jgi:hypothetical protein